MKIAVHHTPKMVADAASYSPSAGKPALVMEAWARLGLPLDVRAPTPVTEQQLCLAHDRDFVSGVLGGRVRNGFGNRLASVASSLPFTSGAMLAAARDALANGWGAVAPCSGFHHAGYDFAGGFCTFNGLMVTAAVLLADGAVRKVGIVDCDQHWGDGTDHIIRRLGLHDHILHYSPTRDFGRPHKAEAFLAQLPDLLQPFADCDLVLYQAGADPHVDDPLGGWMTTEQLQRRDVAVFQALRDWGVPVAWNLAGGYQRDAQGNIQPVLAIHNNTLRAFANTWNIGPRAHSSRAGGVAMAA